MKLRNPKSEAASTVPHQILVDEEIRAEDNPGKLDPWSNIVLAKRRTSKPMRFFERLLVFCVFSLTLGVFCSEVPELLSLYDDPSDDFVSSSSLPEIGSTQTVSQAPTPQRGTARNETLSDLTASRSMVSPSPTGPTLLQLLSIQRK
jgi:hypothetical protein